MASFGEGFEPEEVVLDSSSAVDFLLTGEVPKAPTPSATPFQNKMGREEADYSTLVVDDPVSFLTGGPAKRAPHLADFPKADSDVPIVDEQGEIVGLEDAIGVAEATRRSAERETSIPQEILSKVNLLADGINLGVVRTADLPVKVVTSLLEGGAALVGEELDLSSLEGGAEHWYRKAVSQPDIQSDLDKALSKGGEFAGGSMLLFGGMLHGAGKVAEGVHQGQILKGSLPFFEQMAANPQAALQSEVALNSLAMLGGTMSQLTFGDEDLDRDGDIAFDVGALVTPLGLVGAAALATHVPGVRKISTFVEDHKETLGLFSPFSSTRVATADRTFRKEVSAMLGEADAARLDDRLNTVRDLQRLDPDFQPTLGVILGTEKSLAVQRMVSLHNPEMAAKAYAQTQKAAENIVKKLLADKGVVDSEEKTKQLVMAMDMIVSNSRTRLDQLSSEILEKEQALFREISEGAGDANVSQLGMKLRAEVDELKSLRNDHVDELYGQIDPGNQARWDFRPVRDTLRELLDTKSLDALSEDLMTPAIKRVVGILQDARKRGAFTTQELVTIRKRLGAEGRRLSNSTGPETEWKYGAERLSEAILDTMDGGVLNSADPVAKAVMSNYSRATSYFKNTYVPQFKHYEGAQVGQMGRKGEYKVRGENVPSLYWAKGKRENAHQFKSIFSMDEATAKDPETLAKAQASVIRANESLTNYALYTLEKDLEKAYRNGRPLEQALSQWKSDYAEALEEFPHIAAKVETFGDTLSTISSKSGMLKRLQAEHDGQITKNFFGRDSKEVFDDILSSEQRMDELLGPLFASRSRNAIGDRWGEETTKLDISISRAYKDYIMERTTKPGERIPDPDRMVEFLEKNRKATIRLLGVSEFNSILRFNKGAQMVKEMAPPSTPEELNKMKVVLDSLGFSPASILSRYYAQQRGVVGKPYLLMDATVRILTKGAAKHYDKLYRDLMFDPKGMDKIEAMMAKSLDGEGDKLEGYAKLFLARSGVMYNELPGELFFDLGDEEQDTSGVGDLSESTAITSLLEEGQPMGSEGPSEGLSPLPSTSMGGDEDASPEAAQEVSGQPSGIQSIPDVTGESPLSKTGSALDAKGAAFSQEEILEEIRRRATTAEAFR